MFGPTSNLGVDTYISMAHTYYWNYNQEFPFLHITKSAQSDRGDRELV